MDAVLLAVHREKRFFEVMPLLLKDHRKHRSMFDEDRHMLCADAGADAAVESAVQRTPLHEAAAAGCGSAVASLMAAAASSVRTPARNLTLAQAMALPCFRWP
jgi:hypothetical protein